ncbi:hypothetical protein Tsp_00736 [Trichinella spiralis]|uniref:hypothetical protein n=1 Tax=Trichinella spiralis TaxID=6334 RepID=UPI0001EFCA26|nr:hypothetical protein Tsp_00736 [Trichinella spiralis]
MSSRETCVNDRLYSYIIHNDVTIRSLTTVVNQLTLTKAKDLMMMKVTDPSQYGIFIHFVEYEIRLENSTSVMAQITQMRCNKLEQLSSRVYGIPLPTASFSSSPLRLTTLTSAKQNDNQ